MKSFITRLLATSAAAAVVLGLAAHPAAAFDSISWSWDNDVDQHVKIKVKIDPKTLMPSGITQAEQLQIFAGNLEATARMSDISVTNPMSGGHHHHHGYAPAIDATTGLGFATNAATAVANDMSVTSGVATYLNDAQIATGTYEWPSFYKVLGAGLASEFFLDQFGGNSNLDLALILGVASGQFDLVNPADIDATATVRHVDNLAVGNSATAAANIHTVSVTPVYAPDPTRHGVNSDNIAMVSLTQYAFANIDATASVHDVSFSGYSNMGQFNGLGTPGLVVSNAATALGNVSTIANTVKP